MPAGAGIPQAADLLFKRGQLRRDERLSKSAQFHSAIQTAIERKRQHEADQKQRQKEKRAKNIKTGAMAAGAIGGAIAAPALFAGPALAGTTVPAAAAASLTAPTAAQTIASVGLGASLGGQIAEGDAEGIGRSATQFAQQASASQSASPSATGVRRADVIASLDRMSREFAQTQVQPTVSQSAPIGINPEVLGSEHGPPPQPIAPPSILQQSQGAP